MDTRFYGFPLKPSSRIFEKLLVLHRWFYSDSINDRPLPGRATHPVVMDPDVRLSDLPAEHGGGGAEVGKVTMSDCVVGRSGNYRS